MIFTNRYIFLTKKTRIMLSSTSIPLLILFYFLKATAICEIWICYIFLYLDILRDFYWNKIIAPVSSNPICTLKSCLKSCVNLISTKSNIICTFPMHLGFLTFSSIQPTHFQIAVNKFRSNILVLNSNYLISADLW